MAELDLVIRGGTIVDGTGDARFEADIGIKDGVIAGIGESVGTGHEEIDARGLVVTPGFVDIHTHYDGQATWDSHLTPSSWHGVTTAVMGNCGVGFAPCRPEDHDKLVKLMEGVEDIPGVVLAEGLSWNWESFPEFLEALEANPHDVDFATQVPHGALRVFCMGDRGANREDATSEDIAAMARLAREAVEAGALGFSTSRTLNHRTSDGEPTPTLTAAEDELLGIARALGEIDKGVLQFVSDFKDRETELGMFERLVRESGRPLSVSMAQADGAPDAWRKLIDWVEDCNRRGLPMKGQVAGRPVGLMFGLDTTLNLFRFHPAFRELVKLPLEEKVKRFADPSMKEKLLAHPEDGSERPLMGGAFGDFDKMFLLGDPPDYEQPPENSVGAMARARNMDPAELVYELMLGDDGRAMLYLPFLNYAGGDLEASLAMMKSPGTVLGLGDGGAHLGTICDASFTTHMLTHWTRDRTRGEKLPLETVVRWHTWDTAEAVGLLDRGVIKPGYKADFNIIDYDKLKMTHPEIVRDLPAGGKRLIQRAQGYRYAVVSGEVTYIDGEPTGRLPGKLIRGARTAPAG